MTSVINTVLSSLSPDTELWLQCKDVSESPPRDLPKVREAAKNYRTGRLCARYPEAGDERWIGEWFSLPVSNLRHHLGRHPEMPTEVRIDTLSEEERETVFDDVNIVFQVGYLTTEEEWLWCDPAEDDSQRE